MLWMRHIDNIFIIWKATGVMDKTHIDHIFIIWTTTDVMDKRH